ncbi:IPT/TIG domain-containing protein [Streptomyces sp. NPDC101219]|uniref:IPT/TIG domain-containing protein n=1 Tax=Streptomyces sp. NPDC101219 TaxID=3366131 RepID=UPI0037F47A5B
MPPVLSTVSPSQGPTTGGFSLTLTGGGLIGTTVVRFGSTPAVSHVVHSATQLTAVVPPGSAGTVQVTVTGPSGTSNPVPFTYTAAALPVVSTVTPAAGPAPGGTAVTVTGTGFTGATAVRFAGAPAASFTVHSSTTLTAVTPAGVPGAAAVTVTTPAGSSTATGGAYFFYAAPPLLEGISPPAGPTGGGTAVTLTGSSLLNADAVRFATTGAPSFTVHSATRITAVAPPGPAGVVPVTVSTPGGTSNASAFAYVPAPLLTGLEPAHGPTSAGTVITLTGSGLAAASAVAFDGTPVSFTTVSDTQIAAIAPAGPAGPTTVTVTTPGGTSDGRTYTRLPAPSV